MNDSCFMKTSLLEQGNVLTDLVGQVSAAMRHSPNFYPGFWPTFIGVSSRA